MENNKKINRPEKKFKTTNIKGKDYVEVKERIKYLAFEFQGDYSIETFYKYYPESRLWVVKAKLTMEQNGGKFIYTGLGQEIESDSYKDVNHTSALENAETSAVGRACAMAGIGTDVSIASADEINKAVNRTQNNAAETPKHVQLTNTPDSYKKPTNAATDKQKQLIRNTVNSAKFDKVRDKILNELETYTVTRAKECIDYLLKEVGNK